MMTFLNRPTFLLSACDRLIPWSLGGFVVLGCLGLYMGLIWSPADYQQGETVRIMYVHVPASWGALGVYTAMAISSAIALIKRLPLMHLLTAALAPIGLCFCLISLITGSIWGYPTWGTWWVWDARLTSMLLLAFLYGGYLLLINNFDQEERGLKSGALLSIIGWINVPIIKWSVDWWHTLHQPASILRFAKPAIHWTMIMPLFTMAISFALLALTIFMLQLQNLILKRQLISQNRRRRPS